MARKNGGKGKKRMSHLELLAKTAERFRPIAPLDIRNDLNALAVKNKTALRDGIATWDDWKELMYRLLIAYHLAKEYYDEQTWTDIRQGVVVMDHVYEEFKAGRRGWRLTPAEYETVDECDNAMVELQLQVSQGKHIAFYDKCIEIMAKNYPQL